MRGESLLRVVGFASPVDCVQSVDFLFLVLLGEIFVEPGLVAVGDGGVGGVAETVLVLVAGDAGFELGQRASISVYGNLFPELVMDFVVSSSLQVLDDSEALLEVILLV